MRIMIGMLAAIFTCGVFSLSLVGCGDKDADTAEEVAEEAEAEAEDSGASEAEEEEASTEE